MLIVVNSIYVRLRVLYILNYNVLRTTIHTYEPFTLMPTTQRAP